MVREISFETTDDLDILAQTLAALAKVFVDPQNAAATKGFIYKRRKDYMDMQLVKESNNTDH